MPKLSALPRPIGATVLSLFALILLAATLPAMSQAAPPSSGFPLAATSTDFPKTTVGTGSEKLPVELTNASGESAFVTSFAVEGADAGDFTVNEFPCAMLAPGSSCTAGLYFSPHKVGAEQATLRLDLMGLPSEYVELTGTGVPAELTFSPPSYDFGVVPTNSGSVQQGFQLENDGEAAVQVGNVELAHYNGFSFDFNPNNACSRLMQPGESCWIAVDFGPGNSGLYSEELRASAAGETFSAELSGEGARPEVEVTPSPVDFGAATVGATGSTETITVRNSGKIPTGFFIAVISGGDAGSFRLIDENCTGSELQPGAGCTAHVRFAPLSSGTHKATLSIFGDGDGGMQVPLRGEGVDATVSITPAVLDFGSQVKGTRSSLRTFAFRNNGPTSVSLRTAMIVGANLDQFLLAGDECTGVTLTTGQECLVRLRFAPGTLGAKTAVLRIGSESGVLAVALSGVGTAPAKAAAADSRVRRHRAHFRRGATLSAVRAR